MKLPPQVRTVDRKFCSSIQFLHKCVNVGLELVIGIHNFSFQFLTILAQFHAGFAKVIAWRRRQRRRQRSSACGGPGRNAGCYG